MKKRKLSVEDVKTIRKLYAEAKNKTDFCKQAAKEYQVHHTTIYHAAIGKIYKDIPGAVPHTSLNDSYPLDTMGLIATLRREAGISVTKNMIYHSCNKIGAKRMPHRRLGVKYIFRYGPVLKWLKRHKPELFDNAAVPSRMRRSKKKANKKAPEKEPTLFTPPSTNGNMDEEYVLFLEKEGRIDLLAMLNKMQKSKLKANGVPGLHCPTCKTYDIFKVMGIVRPGLLHPVVLCPYCGSKFTIHSDKTDPLCFEPQERSIRLAPLAEK